MLSRYGARAYSLARDRARMIRNGGDKAGNRYWSRVAMAIAERMGKVIGEQTADRYAEAASKWRR